MVLNVDTFKLRCMWPSGDLLRKMLGGSRRDGDEGSDSGPGRYWCFGYQVGGFIFTILAIYRHRVSFTC